MVYSEDSTIARLLSNGCLIEQPLDNAATIKGLAAGGRGQ